MVEKLVAANVDREILRQEIQDRYAHVATEPEAGFHFHVGRPLAKMLDYDDEDLDWLPRATLESFAGTGNPFSMGRLQPGETVLDLGCGAGVDTLIAARQVGPTGKVLAVDMTEAMLSKMRASAGDLDLENVDARLGFAEDLPVEDASIDVVISNGVINLCPDKEAVMKEIWRVLRPGGRIQIADIIVHKEIPQDAKDDIELWSGWIAGALLEAEWQWLLQHLGFDGVRWGREVDVFSGSANESDAKDFETRGVTIAAFKPKGA